MPITSYRHDGLTFDVVDSGPVDGEVIVLLHGFPQRPSSWEKVTPLLNAQGYRTLAPEQRGYSPGARPRGRASYRGTLLVDDVAALIAEVDTPVHLVGHDWGAAVAWMLAATRPELVRSLVAVSVAHPAAFQRSMFSSDQWRRSWYMAFFQLPLLPERLAASRTLADRFLGPAGMDAEMIERFHREFPTAESLSGPIGWYRGLPLTRGHGLGAKVTVPTTMVWSHHDVALGRAAIDLSERYVRAPYQLEVLEGVSHWIPDEAPEELAGFILERVRGAGSEEDVAGP
jgi:pimeloyl-ACP methyl ester carboxylesterase